jgi:hypothetical protein
MGTGFVGTMDELGDCICLIPCEIRKLGESPAYVRCFHIIRLSIVDPVIPIYPQPIVLLVIPESKEREQKTSGYSPCLKGLVVRVAACWQAGHSITQQALTVGNMLSEHVVAVFFSQRRSCAIWED